MSSALASLEQAGLVREAGRIAPGRGRTAVLYEPDPTAGYVLGIDIGRSWLRVALADLAGTVVARSDVRNRARTSGAMADLVVATARGLIAGSGVPAARVAQAAVGTPGVYDEETGQVRYANQLPGWGKSGLFDRMRQGLDLPLSVHNDANLAALGEYTSGIGAGSRLFAYLLVGTGLGVGVVSGGGCSRAPTAAPARSGSCRGRRLPASATARAATGPGPWRARRPATRSSSRPGRTG